MQPKLNHFWYSPSHHQHKLMQAALEKERGVASPFFAAYLNYVTLEICGEKLEVQYTCMSDNFHAYDDGRWNTEDWVYLGSSSEENIRIVDLNPNLENPFKGYWDERYY